MRTLTQEPYSVCYTGGLPHGSPPPPPLWAVHVPKGKVNDNKCYLSSLQYTSYPGFFPNEVTPLPGQLEAPQLLNRVTKAQCFPVSGCVA